MSHTQIICVFINIYENIKTVIQEWGYTYKINNISATTYTIKNLTDLGYVKMHGFHDSKMGCAYKITLISAVTYPRLLSVVPN